MEPVEKVLLAQHTKPLKPRHYVTTDVPMLPGLTARACTEIYATEKAVFPFHTVTKYSLMREFVSKIAPILSVKR